MVDDGIRSLMLNWKCLDDPISLARIATETPELRKLVFPDAKGRPTEAPFVAWKNSFCNEELECRAGKAPELHI
jgi:hypothetical protein